MKTYTSLFHFSDDVIKSWQMQRTKQNSKPFKYNIHIELKVMKMLNVLYTCTYDGVG